MNTDSPDERWARVKELVAEAAAMPSAVRASWIGANCGGDAALQAEVESLLRAHDAAAGFMAEPAVAQTGAADAVVGAAEAGAPPSPERCGAYRIVRELGRGGMGVVYLGTRDDALFDKTVAIKIVSRDRVHPAVLQRFEDERRILASLEHPGIARLLDAGTTAAGLPYVVMEYVAGEAMDEYCAKRRLAVRERLELFAHVCAAVQYSHQHLVVHRDIKPSNILVTADGVPKLLDFGIARLLEPGRDADEATRTAFRALTPESASPEQVRGDPVTVASDVYSLGVLLYRLLAGCSPYRSDLGTEAGLVHAVCEEQPRRPSEAAGRQELRGDLDMIVLMALRKEPSRRYPSVEQLADDVLRHLSGRPVRARPDTFSYRTGKFVRRHRAAVAAGTLVAVSLVAGIAGTTWQARVAGLERARAERRFQDVRQLANAFIFDVHDSIETLPGATHAREVVVKKALEYLGRLAGEAAGDRVLQEELATAYQKVGDVQGLPDAPSVGDYQGALASYERALALREAVAARDPAARRAVSVVLNRIGRLRLFLGDHPGALAAERRSVRLAEELAASATPAARRDLMLALLLLGDVLAEMGDLTGAIEHYGRAVGLAEALQGEQADERSQRDLSVAYDFMARALRDSGRLEEALAVSGKSLAIDRALNASQASNIHVRRDLGVSLQRVGQLQSGLGQPAAVATLTEAVAVGRALLQLDPADADARHGVSVSEFHLAEALARQKEVERALVHYHRSLALTDRLLEKDTPATYRADRAETLWRMGAALAAKGRRAAAVAATRDALLLAEPLAQETPGNPELLVKVAAMQAQMAALLGDPCGRSRPWLQKALAGLQGGKGRLAETVAAENHLSADDLSARLAGCGSESADGR
jgi:non-specific serine/threonine protein kinase/serine/threonine-protein kinase